MTIKPTLTSTNPHAGNMGCKVGSFQLPVTSKNTEHKSYKTHKTYIIDLNHQPKVSSSTIRENSCLFVVSAAGSNTSYL